MPSAADAPFTRRAQLLRKDPEQRLTLAQLLAHPWLTSGGTRPLTLRPSLDVLAVRLGPVDAPTAAMLTR